MDVVDLHILTPVALWLLRVIVGIIFFSSGQSHIMYPKERGERIGMSSSVTMVLGIVEILASLAIILGIFPQLGAALIMLIMCGAMAKKIFVWKTKFYEDNGYGWHYDLLLCLAAFVILVTNGGAYIIM